MLRAGLRFLVALSGLPFLAGTSPPARTLTLEARISAQEAIERVHHSHQLGATRLFEEVVPREEHELKVRTCLKQSVPLQKRWNRPVTAEFLRQELPRFSLRG